MDPIAERVLVVLACLFGAAGVFIAIAERVSGRPAGRIWTSFWVQFLIVGYLLVPAWLGGPWYVGAIALMAAQCLREMLSVLRAKGLSPFAPLAYGGTAAFLALAAVGELRGLLAAPVVLAGVLGALALWGGGKRRRDAAVTGLALIFPGWCLAFALTLGKLPGGFGLIVFLYAVVELNDSVALLVGKFFGKTLIWPRLSPSKTVAGSVAGLVGAVAAAGAFSFAVPQLSLWMCLAAGAVLGVLGQAADLAASGVKRWAGVKDYGALVPTHGGVLDVYDSFILTAPFWVLVALLLR